MSSDVLNSTKDYSISPKEISDNDIVMSIAGEYAYSGSQISPTNISGLLGEISIIINTDFTIVSYGNNINAGTGTVTINGKDNYTGSRTLEFIIEKGVVTFELDSDKDYLLVGESITAVTLLNGETTSLNISSTITYNNSISLPTSVGSYNYIVSADETDNYTVVLLNGTIDVCMEINPSDLTVDVYYNGNIYQNDATYNGSEIEFSVKVSYNNVELNSSLYSTSFSDKTNAGNHVLTISGNGNRVEGMYYIISSNSIQKSYTIQKLKISISTECISENYRDSLNWDTIKLELLEQVTFIKTSDQTAFTLKTSEYSILGMNNGYYYYGYGSQSSAVSGFIKPETEHLIGSTYIVSVNVGNNYILEGNKYFVFKYRTAIISGNTDNYYTIEEAIYTASSTDTIILKGVASNTHYINTSFTKIDRNITGYSDDHYKLECKLRVPFADVDLDYHGSGGETGKTSNQYDSTPVTVNDTVFSVLTIPTDISLTLSKDSHLVVGGLVAASSQVFNRGVVMNNGSIIANDDSNISSFGYIKGTGTLETHGGRVVDVFRIYDWRGGGKTAGLNSAKIFPINAFSIHNISCQTKIYAGTNYEAFWTIKFDNPLYTGYQRGDKNGNIVLVGSNGLFNLIDGYILKSANEGITNSSKTELSTIIGNNQLNGQKDDIKIYGKCYDSSVSLSISVTGMSFDINTSTNFPVSIGYMDVTVGNDSKGNVGNLSLGTSSYKFYPGTSLTVEEGATLTIKKGVNLTMFTIEKAILDQSVICSKFITSAGTGDYCVDRYDATLNVEGTLKVESGAYVGGKILTQGSSGKISIAEYNYSNVKYAISYKEGLLTDEYGTDTSTNNAYLYLYDDASNSVLEQLSQPSINSNYYAKNGGWIIGTTEYQIEYEYRYFDGCESSGTIENSNPSKFTPDDTIILSTPKNGDLTFMGWYLDENCTIPITSIIGYKNLQNVKLYGKWQRIEVQKYTITFDSDGGTDINPIELPAGAMVAGPANPTKVGHDFVGWYTESGEKYTFDSNTKMPEQNITLIAHWELTKYTLSITGSANYYLIIIRDGNEITAETGMIIYYTDTIKTRVQGAQGGLFSSGASKTVSITGASGQSYGTATGSGGGAFFKDGSWSDYITKSEITEDITVSFS